MSKPTLAISSELERLLLIEANREEVSLNSLIVRACWQYLDRAATPRPTKT